MHRILLAGLALGVCLPARASSPTTLCHADETVVFSCATGVARIASICASKPINKETGTIQYRFGQPDKLELVVPETPQRPLGLFTPGTLAFSGGGGAYLRFGKGAYRYTVFTAIGNWGRTGKASVAGVAVTSDGKTVANLPCRRPAEAADGELGPDFFDRAGLGEPVTDFNIPDAFFPR